jgi:hypothetical protein
LPPEPSSGLLIGRHPGRQAGPPCLLAGLLPGGLLSGPCTGPLVARRWLGLSLERGAECCQAAAGGVFGAMLVCQGRRVDAQTEGEAWAGRAESQD